MRQQRDFRHQAEALHHFRRAQRDLRQFRGGGVQVDVRIDDEHLARRQYQRVHRGVHRGSRRLADHAVDVLQVPGRGADGSADHAVGVALAQQHGGDERGPPAHFKFGKLGGDTAAVHEAVVLHPELAVPVVLLGVDDGAVRAQAQPHTKLLDARLEHLGTPDQDGVRDLLFGDDLHGPQHALVLALGEHDARALEPGAPRGRVHRLHDGAGLVHELLQLLLIGVEVGDGPRGDARLHGGLRDGRRDVHDEPRIEGLRDQVVRAEGEIGDAIGAGDHVAVAHAREIGDGAHRGHFHGARDAGGAGVQRAAEDERETQDIVDLVRVVAAARGHDGIVAHRAHFGRQDLGRGVRKREDQRARGHGLDHVWLEHAAGAQTQEDVRADDGFGQRTQLGGLREARLVRVHELGAAFMHQAGEIGEPDVFLGQADVHQQVHAGQRRRTRATDYQLDLVQLLADDREPVQRSRRNNNGGAVLVVMEHRDLHARAQLALDLETLGRLDVLEIDAAKSRFQGGNDFDQLVRVTLVDLDVEHIDVGELLEQHRLAFHHRLGGERPDGAEAENGRAVGDDADQVAARGVAQRGQWIRRDLLAGDGDTG